MIDPDKLADAAAMRAREASDRLTRRSTGVGDVDGPMHGTKTQLVEATCDEVREAFIAGARWHETMTDLGVVATVGGIASMLGIIPKNWVDRLNGLGPANDSPADPVVREAMVIEQRAAEIAIGDEPDPYHTVREWFGWVDHGMPDVLTVAAPLVDSADWHAGWLAHAIVVHDTEDA